MIGINAAMVAPTPEILTELVFISVSRDLRITAINDADALDRVLRLLFHARDLENEVRPALERLPHTLKGVSLAFALYDLMNAEAEQSFEFEVLPHDDTAAS